MWPASCASRRGSPVSTRRGRPARSIEFLLGRDDEQGVGPESRDHRGRELLVAAAEQEALAADHRDHGFRRMTGDRVERLALGDVAGDEPTILHDIDPQRRVRDGQLPRHCGECAARGRTGSARRAAGEATAPAAARAHGGRLARRCRRLARLGAAGRRRHLHEREQPRVRAPGAQELSSSRSRISASLRREPSGWSATRPPASGRDRCHREAAGVHLHSGGNPEQGDVVTQRRARHPARCRRHRRRAPDGRPRPRMPRRRVSCRRRWSRPARPVRRRRVARGRMHAPRPRPACRLPSVPRAPDARPRAPQGRRPHGSVALAAGPARNASRCTASPSLPTSPTGPPTPATGFTTTPIVGWS